MAITTALSDTGTTSTTTPTITLPASVASGDLLLAFAAQDGAGTWTWPGSWVDILDHAGTGFTLHVAYLIAAGGETSVVPTSSISERSNHIAVRVPAAEWHGTTPPEISTGATGSSTTPDPDALTPSWGSALTRWIALFGADQSTDPLPVTGWPTNYTDNQVENHTTTSSAAVLAMASRAATATTEDPGAFTMTATETWSAFTIGIRPAAGGSAVNRTTTDALTLADSVVRAGGFIRTVADSTGLADAVTRAGTFLRTVADALGLADAAVASRTYLRSVADSLSLSDAPTRAGTFLRTTTDAVTHSDAVTRVVALIRAATDAATYSDAATRANATARTAADSLGLSDAATRAATLVRSAADALGLSDAVVAVKDGAVTLGTAVLSFPLVQHALQVLSSAFAAVFSLPVTHHATMTTTALEYDLNDTVSPTCTFTVSDVNTDPTTISLTVREPDGTTTTYTYAAAQITKSATGIYTKNITLDVRGVWLFQWAGTGTCQASAEGTVTVRN